MKKSTLFISLVVFACTPGGGPNDPSSLDNREKIVIGEEIDESACFFNEDCPQGFVCDNGLCSAVDNDLDNDGYDASVDCDDGSGSVNPGRAEVCNQVDDDCDGNIDEGVQNACGFCGEVPVEVCDLVDNDCDGLVDEECQVGALEEEEPNDGQAACQPIALPPNEGDTLIYSGALNPASDVDSFCFFVRGGSRLTFDIDSQVLGAPTDGVLALFQGNGELYPDGRNDFFGGPDPFLDYTFPVDDQVRLDVSNFDPIGGPDHIYELRITAETLVECGDADGDGSSNCDGDCNDNDARVFPGQTEVCDEVDNNCDGVVDEQADGETCPDPSTAETEPNEIPAECQLFTLPLDITGNIGVNRDKDTFCFFVPSGVQVGFDIDAKETSTSLLNSRLRLRDLSGEQLAQNDDGVDPDTGFTDNDSDSFLLFTFEQPGVFAIEVTDERTFSSSDRHTYRLRAAANNAPPCSDVDADGVSTCEGDCDDADASVHFGAEEICDGKDNNCDGVTDFESCTGDFDGDGQAGIDGDCDDGDPTRFFGAVEVCDGRDTDCDGEVDEGVQNACGGCGAPPAELCGDGIDNDCNGVVDTDCNDDVDQDGETKGEGDCNDNNPDVNTSAGEICDGLDNDCDGRVDEFVKNACGQCAPEPEELCDGLDNNCNGQIDDGVLNACGECGPAPEEVCDGFDNDCDGDVDEGVANACGGCGPTPVEICDGLDNDCDGEFDEGCDVDADNDGLTPREGDCDDDNINVFFGQTETCGDALDANCNGDLDDLGDCPVPTESESNDTIASCDAFAFPNAVAGDISSLSDLDVFCVNVDAGVTVAFDVEARDSGSALDGLVRVFDSGGALLASNNNDPRGGGSLDPYLEFTPDQSGTFAVQLSPANSEAISDAPYVLDARAIAGPIDQDGDGSTFETGDCDDFSAAISPGAIDVCDGIDNNCDGVPDERCVNGCLDDLLEENDSAVNAVVVTSGSVPALTSCGGDLDFFAVDTLSGQIIDVRILFSHAAGDLTLEVLAPNGVTVIGASTSTNDNEQVTVATTEDGLHFIRVSSPLGVETPYELDLLSP